MFRTYKIDGIVQAGIDEENGLGFVTPEGYCKMFGVTREEFEAGVKPYDVMVIEGENSDGDTQSLQVISLARAIELGYSDKPQVVQQLAVYGLFSSLCISAK